MPNSLPTLAVIGGTGALGSGLAARWTRAGYLVVLGSRSKEKAEAAADKLQARPGGPPVRGADNAAAAALGDIVIITVPFASHAAILDEIRESVSEKIVVDATVPLVPPKVGTVQLPGAGCAAAMTQAALGDRAEVVSAFHNVAAEKLQGSGDVDCDVLVCGNKRSARRSVIELVEALGLRGIHAGPLANSAAAEAMTSVLITINKLYKVKGAGIRITGELNSPEAEVAS